MKYLAPFLLLANAACHAVAPTPPAEAALARARMYWERGAWSSVLGECDEVVARAAPGSTGDALRSFSASVLATRAHERAAGVEPFFAAPDGSRSAIAHLVAVSFHARAARGTLARLSVADDAALPYGVESIDRAAEHLFVAETAAHARLGFKASIAHAFEARPELGKLEGAEAVLALAEPERGSEAWFWYALFRYQCTRDSVEAYRCGALAIDRGADGAELSEIELWIANDSGLEFRCPKCELPAVLRLRSCPNDQTPNVEFRAHPRASR